MRGEKTLLDSWFLPKSAMILLLFLSVSWPLFAGSPHYAIISEGESGVHCLDQQALGVNKPEYLINLCAQSGGESATFTLDDNDYCVSYEGTNVAGLDTACIVLCSSGFICDTTYFYISTLPTTPVVVDTMLINSEKTLCYFDFPNITGPITFLENFCDGNTPQNVDFDIDPINYCVEYKGISHGLGRACLRARDNNSSGAVYFDVFVRMPEPEYLSVEMDEGESVEICPGALELFGRDKQGFSICGSSDVFNYNYSIDNNCFNIVGLQEGTDLLCFVVCDDLDVCDSIEVEVNVLYRQTLTEPIVSNDEFDAEIGIENVYVLCDNDEIPVEEEPTMRIVPASEGGAGPFLGTASIDEFSCELIYEPLENACELIDSVMYEVCNSSGCDRAMVYINIVCEKEPETFGVYSGFSPNGDDTNETLVVGGLDQYPNHTLSIFNRWGAQLLEVKDYQNDWAGTWNGKDMPEGVYYYMLDTGEGDITSGWFVIHR
ncbi:MAG: gliding motility-associated C-terminal domain-containing protein [Saprospiraceae bacterium]|nr:gliding motility-associated C-terminal domain-containing protein [Saprospiraceae bacterium]